MSLQLQDLLATGATPDYLLHHLPAPASHNNQQQQQQHQQPQNHLNLNPSQKPPSSSSASSSSASSSAANTPSLAQCNTSRLEATNQANGQRRHHHESQRRPQQQPSQSSSADMKQSSGWQQQQYQLAQALMSLGASASSSLNLNLNLNHNNPSLALNPNHQPLNMNQHHLGPFAANGDIMLHHKTSQQQQQQQMLDYQQGLLALLMQLTGNAIAAANTPPPPPPPPPRPSHSPHHLQHHKMPSPLEPASCEPHWRLLESLYEMNDEPEEEAIELIARRINSTPLEVATWFKIRRAATRCNNNTTNTNAQQSSSAIDIANLSPLDIGAGNLAAGQQPANLHHHNHQHQHLSNHQPPTNGENLAKTAVPSSSLLAKLNAVTSRLQSPVNQQQQQFDQKILDLLEAFYAINDNPEPAAIEMIAKRIGLSQEAIGDWFDRQRLKQNPMAGPRSPPAKKREGGRVVTFSEYQRSLLEAIFDENNYLHPQEYEELSNLIQVPSRNIKIWFKNRRSKQRLSGRTAHNHVNNNNNSE